MANASIRVGNHERDIVPVSSTVHMPPPTDRAPVTLDIETNGLPVYDPDFQVRTIQLNSPVWPAAYVVPARIEYYYQIDEILKAAPAIIGHNLMYEWQSLARVDLNDNEGVYWDKSIDTQLGVAVIAHPDSPSGDKRLGLKDNVRALVDPDYDLDKSLKACMAEGWQEVVGEYKSGARKGQPKLKRHRYTWETVPMDSPEFLRYAAGDVVVPELLWDKLHGAAYERAPEHYKMARDLSKLLGGRIKRGLEVDEGVLLSEETKNAEQIAGVRPILEAHGINADKGNTADNKAILIQALKDAGIKVPMTKGTDNAPPAPSIARDMVTLAADGRPIPAVLAAWYEKEQASKFRSAYLDRFREALEDGDGSVHPDIKNMEAATGRTSVGSPPLHQIPTHGGTRGCLRARYGFVLVTADLSQIEFRIGGGLSQDSNLIEMVLNGTKIHNVVANLVWGASFTEYQYNSAKTAVYAWLYGATANTIAKQTGVSKATAIKIIKTIEAMFPDLVALKKDRMSMRRATTWYGREILLNNDAPWGKLNYEIQGTAYDLFTIGTLKAADELGWDNIWLTVHDEVIAEVPEEDATDAMHILSACLTTEYMGIPCPAEAKILGRNWRK